MPTCVVPLNTQFYFYFIGGQVSKEGVPSYGMSLGFTSANLLECSKKRRAHFMARASFLPPYIGGCDSIPFFFWALVGLPFSFFFFSFFCFSGRERDISKHQVSRRTPYPFNAATDSNRPECAYCCWGGVVMGPYAGPCLFRTKSEI